MFDSLALLAILGGVLAAVWYAARPRPVFVIRIRDGIPHVTRGRATDSVLKAVADVCRWGGVTSGTISGIRDGRRIRLKCSSTIPAGCQQQLRNTMLAEL